MNNSLFDTVQGALRLDARTFRQMRDDPDGLRRGILIIVAVSLLVALPGFINHWVQSSRPLDAASLEQRVRRMIGPAETWWPAEFRAEFLSNFEAGLRVGTAVAALPTRLSGGLTGFLQALGGYVSAPFAWLGGWAAYLIWVMLVAKLMGGTGGIRQMMSTTSLFAVPGALGVLGFIPYIGGILQLVAFVWGVAIYAKGIAVANEFDDARAWLVTVLPVLLGLIVLFAVLTVLSFIALVASF